MRTAVKIALYLFFFLIPFMAVSFYFNGKFRQSEFYEITNYYKKNANQYNLIFLGDSRTYTGIQPKLIDQRLKTTSLNIATFANWIPTQYPQIEEIISSIPKETIVVWSIGYNNFHRVADWRWAHNSVYFIGLHNIAYYIKIGFPVRVIINHLWKTSSLKEGLTWVKQGYFYEFSTSLKQNKFSEKTTTKALKKTNPYAKNYIIDGKKMSLYQIEASLEKDPFTSKFTEVVDGSDITSLVVHTKRGNYVRIELLPDYFREKQLEWWNKNRRPKEAYKPEDCYWKLFVAILDLFQKNNIKLIVNEIEEAPFHYNEKGFYTEGQAFSNEKVRPYVESRGIPYIRADFSQLDDSDYFDYNHLNSKGGHKYAELLSNKLYKTIMNFR